MLAHVWGPVTGLALQDFRLITVKLLLCFLFHHLDGALPTRLNCLQTFF